MGGETPLEWWLKKVKYILRNYYNEVKLQAWHVRLDVGDFYDVEMRNRFGTTIYMDSLDKEDVNKLVRALGIMCGKPIHEEHGTDGSFWMKFKCEGE